MNMHELNFDNTIEYLDHRNLGVSKQKWKKLTRPFPYISVFSLNIDASGLPI